MKEKEKKILNTFKAVLPKLSEKQQDRLVWFGEGMAFNKEEKEDGKEQTA